MKATPRKATSSSASRREFLALLGMTAAGGTLLAAEARPERRKAMVIDAHCHAGKGLNFGKEGADPWTTFNDPERTLRSMEQAGIDTTIIFPINNTTYEKANEEIASYVKKYPGKFIGFAKHGQRTEAGKIRALLTREVKELGLKGLKLHDAPTPEMLEVVADLKIPILCHPGKVADLREPVAAWPETDFILAHLGNFASHDWREHLAAIDLAKRFPNLYLDTSGVIFFDFLEQAARELPAEKLIFGSDGPLVDQRVELYRIRLLGLPREKEELVLSGNILRLLSRTRR
jgi:uncharacterized protein